MKRSTRDRTVNNERQRLGYTHNSMNLEHIDCLKDGYDSQLRPVAYFLVYRTSGWGREEQNELSRHLPDSLRWYCNF